MSASSETVLVLVLVQLIVIILAARAAGSVAAAIGQPRSVGEIAAGLLLGPSFLGHFSPGLSAALFAPEANGPIGCGARFYAVARSSPSTGSRSTYPRPQTVSI